MLSGILERGGVKPWPKPMQNLRLTRRNELEAKHPHHVVNWWMGHSSSTASKHYLRVTNEDWEAGAKQSTMPIANDTAKTVGGVVPAALGASGEGLGMKKPLKTLGIEGPGCLQHSKKMPPLGLEPRTHGLRVRCSTN